jgi:hydrogenase-4 component B
MSVEIALSAVVALLAVAALAVWRSRSRRACRLVYGTCLAVSSLVLLAALAQLLGLAGPARTLTLPLGVPWIGARFRIDALAAFFLVVVNLGGAAASLYGLGYGRHETAPERVLPCYPAFLAAMNLVVLAHDAFTFLLAWEFMSLASWALVVSHHRESLNTRAGYVYLAMASFGTLALLLAFGLLAGPTGAYDFAAMREADHGALTAALVLGLVLLGAGSKAGLVPLHVWLPLAHPAAPSHVSALMSGVMTKVAIYGFIRILLDLLGEPVWWSSVVVLFLGGVTAVMGILYALMQSDLKRLLGLQHHRECRRDLRRPRPDPRLHRERHDRCRGPGADRLALPRPQPFALQEPALHGGRGRAHRHGRARHGEAGRADPPPAGDQLRLPGRCRRHLGPAAVERFRSEWLLFQAILLSPDLPDWGLKVMVPAVGGMLALAAALAAACFVKAFGITFLGRARSEAALAAHEVDRYSLAAMGCLAGLCLLAGIFPGLVIDALAPVADTLVGQPMPRQATQPWLSIVPVAESRSSYNGLLVFAFIALSATATAWVVHRYGSRLARRGIAWGCGFDEPVRAGQYSAPSFAQPIQRVFGPLLFRSSETVEMPPPGSLGPSRHRLVLHDLVWDLLYAPIAGLVSGAADRLNVLQFLTIRRYLSFVFAALVVLLLALALWA